MPSLLRPSIAIASKGAVAAAVTGNDTHGGRNALCFHGSALQRRRALEDLLCVPRVLFVGCVALLWRLGRG